VDLFYELSFIYRRSLNTNKELERRGIFSIKSTSFNKGEKIKALNLLLIVLV
jgi:hypothetical protein